MSSKGYGTGEVAPGRVYPGVGNYIAAHNMIKAHVQTYRMYKKLYSDQQGKLTIGSQVDVSFVYFIV